MNKLFKFLVYLSAINGTLLFYRPFDNALKTILWIPKLTAAATAPILGMAGFIGALIGLVKKDWKLAGAGVFGAGLAAKFVNDIQDASPQFQANFRKDANTKMPAQANEAVDFQPDLIIGEKPHTGKPYFADLWRPPAGVPFSGLGIIYVHGSGWRVGDKDMLTRPFFRRLADQGHVVLDIAYTLYPEADIPTMVAEVNQAILWMKKSSQRLQINPERIVLIGGSAGGHLSLLAAYAPEQAEFQIPGMSGDTKVRGVIGFYPVVDLWSTSSHQLQQSKPLTRPLDSIATAFLNRVFNIQPELARQGKSGDTPPVDFIENILGGSKQETPEMYDLLSPIKHVHKDCPPTLILQGSDDVFGLAAPVRRFHQVLQQAGVPVILVEYPHTEHGFDLLLPQISPAARAATTEVERFLTRLV